MLKLQIINQEDPIPPNNPIINQNWSVERIAKEAVPFSWEEVFKDAKHELKDISDILIDQEKQYGTFYPNKEDIFSAFTLTQLNKVKVVIIGQDPYHQTISLNGKVLSRAHGLSFSVRHGDAIPSSLNNIYKELVKTVYGFEIPTHGNLTGWASQGILMLNMCLTVRPNQAGSHGDIWLGFINKALRAINTINPRCIYLLWGREAQKIRPMLGDNPVVFEAAHPSGLSANRGFFGCNHFRLVNDTLIKQGKVGINWSQLSPPVIRTAPVSNNTNFSVINYDNLSNVQREKDAQIKAPIKSDNEIKLPVIPSLF